jgi:hypothetical protein
MWTIQAMPELGECDELSLAHLPFGLFHERALFRGDYVIRINHAPGFDEHAILLFREGDKISFSDIEGFEHMPRNDYLAPLAHAADPVLGGG